MIHVIYMIYIYYIILYSQQNRTRSELGMYLGFPGKMKVTWGWRDGSAEDVSLVSQHLQQAGHNSL